METHTHTPLPLPLYFISVQVAFSSGGFNAPIRESKPKGKKKKTSKPKPLSKGRQANISPEAPHVESLEAVEAKPVRL